VVAVAVLCSGVERVVKALDLSRRCWRPGEVGVKDVGLGGHLGQETPLVQGGGVDPQHRLLGAVAEAGGEPVIVDLEKRLLSQGYSCRVL
jgi:hypothetical protein